MKKVVAIIVLDFYKKYFDNRSHRKFFSNCDLNLQ